MIQHDFPGSELLEQGLVELNAGNLTPVALAICTMRKRLCALGVEVAPAELTDFPEILMYQALGALGESNPHSAMNAILRRLDAYASTAEARRLRAAAT